MNTMNEVFRDNDFISRRFRRMLWRWWWMALLLAAIGAFSSARIMAPTYTSKTEIRLSSTSALLKSMELVQDMPTAERDVIYITSREFEEQVESEVGSALQVTVGATDYSVSISVLASTQSAALQAADLYKQEFFLARKGHVSQILKELQENLEGVLKKNETRIAEITAELAQLEDPSGSLAQALLFDRSTAASENIETSQKLSALDTVLRDTSGDDSSSQELRRAESRVLEEVLPGASAGLFLGVVALYLLACLDRKVRFRDDLVAITGADLLGVMTSATNTKLERQLVTVVGAATRRHGDSKIQLLIVDDDVAQTQGFDRLKQLLAPVCTIGSDRGSNWDSTVVQEVLPTILVATYGRSTVLGVEQAVREVLLGGQPLLGSILIDVPNRHLERVLETSFSRFRLF